MELVLIRHAESLFNIKLSTDLNSGLSLKGINQAYRTGIFLNDYLKGKWHVHTSPFTRCKNTAGPIYDICFKKLNEFINEDWRLREHIYELNGYTENQLPLTVGEYTLNEIDTDETILGRLREFYNGLNRNENHIIFSHGTPIQTLREFTQGRFTLPVWDKSVKNCGITHIINDKIVLDNYTEHLETIKED